MKCVVTGGAGFIGSHLVHRLVHDGHEVVVIDDLSTGDETRLADVRSRIVFVRHDIQDDVSGIVKPGVDVVFHLAARPRVQFSMKEPVLTHKVNVDGTLNLLLAARDAKVKRFVFSSSSSVYGDQDVLPLSESMAPRPMSPYAAQKWIGEQYCGLFHALWGLPTVALRYFNVYGPGMDPNGAYACMIPKFIMLARQGKAPTIFGDGEQSRDFTFVDDVVEANLLAATTQNSDCFGRVFNIGAQEGVSVNQVTGMILDLGHSQVKPVHLDPVVEPKHTLSDSASAQRMLGWSPKMDIASGLRLVAESMRSAR
ncbi:MAG: NAD-dependent epimerase/dehydratase family protein [Nanoarchaeota archaeon]